MSHGGEGEEARRDTDGDLGLVAAKTQMVESLLWVLGIQLQDVRHAGARSRERERVIQRKVAATEFQEPHLDGVLQVKEDRQLEVPLWPRLRRKA